MPHSSSILRYELCIYEDLQSAHQNENTGLSRFLSAKRIDFKLKITLLVQLCQVSIILPPWLLYVWIKDSRFGAQPECNHLVKYVFFYVTVRATVNWLRISFLVGVSLGLFYALTSLRSIPALLKALFASSDEASDTEYIPAMSFSKTPWISSVMWVPSWFPRCFYLTNTKTNTLSQACSLWCCEH